MKVDKIARQKLRAWCCGGLEVIGDGEREVRRGEWGELGRIGWLGWRKGGYGSREVYILIKGAILGLVRDLTLEGFPGPTRCPQLVPYATEERVPELALSHT